MKSVCIKSANYIKHSKGKQRGGALTALTLTLTIYNHRWKAILYNILKWYSLTMLESYKIFYYYSITKLLLFLEMFF